MHLNKTAITDKSLDLEVENRNSFPEFFDYQLQIKN